MQNDKEMIAPLALGEPIDGSLIPESEVHKSCKI
jgi:hypothetical protein